MSEYPFRSASEALRFALTFSMGAKPNRDAVNQLAAPTKSTGRGLGGMDGAAQAGMVLLELKACGEFYSNLLIAKVAPRKLPCSCKSACCSGFTPNWDWTYAFGYLVSKVLVEMQGRSDRVRGLAQNHYLRSHLVMKYLGSNESVKDIAKEADVSEQTAHSHRKMIFSILHEAESKSWKEIEQRLIVAGITNPIE